MMTRTRKTRPAAVLIGLLLGVAAVVSVGCDAETGSMTPNLPPNTRISAGPPEATDTSYRVNLFWFGWDDDGFVDHYEIAWEEPTDWIGPIFSNDSLFQVIASESCCVDPLPGQGTPSEAIYEQFHTFYVRAVDDLGMGDETPAVRSFNAKTIAPSTVIDAERSPQQLSRWGSRVVFYWNSSDDDGTVESYKYALTSVYDYARITGDTFPNVGEIIDWLDTLTYYPRPGGGFFEDSLVWRDTEEDSVAFENVITTFGSPNSVIFGVRAIDNAGAEEVVLERNANVVVFNVDRAANGPVITINSNIIGTWRNSTPRTPRGVFATSGIRFNWRATPGPSGSEVAGFRYAVDDTSDWTPYSLNNEEYPVQVSEDGPDLWFPDGGPHTFFVESIDRAGFSSVLPVNLRVFEGPQFCPGEDRYILVVTDTNPGALIQDSRVFPASYREVERSLISYYFEDYNIQLHETVSNVPPEVNQMDCASSMFWFLSTDAGADDPSVLESYHDAPPNVLPSYIASGGNLFICGIQPLNAVRYFEDNEGQTREEGNTPVIFSSSIQDTSVVDHWMTTQFGISQIDQTVDIVDALDPSLRVARAHSLVRTGPNPYPDLNFDPLSWPNGPQYRGFAFYDRGIQPVLRSDSTQVAQPIYAVDDENGPVMAVRKLTSPGPQGNTMYVGFHPYFVDKAAFRQFLRAVLTDFGEFPQS